MMRLLAISLGCCVACSGAPDEGARRPVEPSAAPGSEQTVAEGMRILCDSGWDGHTEGDRFRRWIPDELARKITNDYVIHVMGALTSPDVDGAKLLDAALAESGLATMSCPLREQWATRAR